MQFSPFPDVILIDQHDQEIGKAEKIKAHQDGLLHRAFSVCLYRPIHPSLSLDPFKNFELLLQKRHKTKYHSGGLWTNTCCSHPQPNQNIQTEAEKSLLYEMGITASLKEISVFHYKGSLGNDLIENEIDHVFAGQFSPQSFSPNFQEIEDYQWISLDSLKKRLKSSSSEFTIWFPKVFNVFCDYIEQKEKGGSF